MFGLPNRRADHIRTLERPRATPKISPDFDWSRVIVLANRAPFRHERATDGRVVVKRSASGLVTALEPLIESYSGIWVAHGAGNADTAVVDDRGGLNVPPASPQYRLRYVWLPDDEHQGYYYGFANEGLWPLCHAVDVQPVFRPDDFRMYRAANTRFAAAVAEEAGGGSPLVLVQDYHFALAPRALRQRLPWSTVVAFWHIPWPRPRMFRTCPWARELLEGLLGSNIVGLQTEDDCMNFLGCVESILHADVDLLQNTVTYRGHSTNVRAYPVGVAWANQVVRTTPPSSACRERVGRDLQLPSRVQLGVGIDRLDYTKGINEKFLAIERLFELRPEVRGHFVFVQVAEPSRDCLPAYRAARTQLIDTSERVNSRFGTSSYRPIQLLEAHHEPDEVYRFYRAADLCYVASLHDGMNLVAKEFVCARDDERGVLVLSQFAGAAQQLRGALLVNPSDVDRSAGVLADALGMSIAEQSKRMRLLRANVATFDASWWAQQLIHDAKRHGHRSHTVTGRPRVVAQRISA
jgi:trehalose 6-phosphate synthase